MTRPIGALVGLLALSYGLALHQGQDGNWDLLNYHLYNSFAWLEGRYDIDLAPAQRQTWHNPLIDLPFYLLANAPVSGVWPTLWLALPAGVGLWLCLRLLELVALPRPSPIAQVACVMIAASGAGAYTSIGTTFNEWPIAAALLAALFLLLRELAREAPRPRWIALAGLMAGAAFGLKYTAYYNCLALAALCLLTAPRGHRLRSMAALAAGGSAGALLTAGYWVWFVYEQTGNPIFPYYNDVFDSPQAESANFRGPASAVMASRHVLSAVVSLAAGTLGFSEIYVRDARLLAGVILSTTMLPALLWPRRDALREHDRHLVALLIFFIASLILWRVNFAKVRFAIVPECVVAVAVVATVTRITRPALRALLLTTLGVAFLFGTDRPLWRRISFSTPFLDTRHPALPEDSAVVILTGEPLAYATVGLPAEIPVYSLFNNMIGPGRCTPGLDQALERLSRATHIWALQQLEAPSELELSNGRLYGFSAPGECRKIECSLADAWLCTLKIDKPLSCAR